MKLQTLQILQIFLSDWSPSFLQAQDVVWHVFLFNSRRVLRLAVAVPGYVPRFPTVAARPRICSSRRHESAFSCSSFRCPRFRTVSRYVSNFLACVASLRCRSFSLSSFPFALAVRDVLHSCEDLVTAASLRHHLDRLNDLLWRLLTLSLGLVHCVQRNRWPNAQVLHALRVLLEEPLELGKTRKLFAQDIVLDDLWQLAHDDVALVFVVGRRSPDHHEVLDRALVPLYACHDIVYRLDDVRVPHLLSQDHSYRSLLGHWSCPPPAVEVRDQPESDLAFA